VGYVEQYSLVASTPTFNVADTRIVINDTDDPATATFTAQRSRTFSLTVGAGASASGLLDFLQVSVSTSIVMSVTTATSVSTTGQVPPHSQLIGEYGVQAFTVTYDITTYRIVARMACEPYSVQRNTTNAPTNIQGWRLRTA
jgi:hypothetical protein